MENILNKLYKSGLFLLTIFLFSCSTAQQVKLIHSIPDRNILFEESTVSEFRADLTEMIQIDPAQKFQQIDGVGAALTHASAYVLNQLDKTKRDSVLKVLFTPEGIGINYTRLCVGASDFATDLFNYSESEDFELKNFNLSRDRADVLPVLKEILKINPGLHIMASPWSAPGWMKTSGSMVGGRLRTECYAVYADYLIRYLEEYAKEGIHIETMTVQNEPLFGTAAYSCMDMSSEEQKVFIRDFLGPKLESKNIDTKIVLYDHNCDRPEYPINILNDSIARKYTVGSGFHLYAGDISALCLVKEKHPDKDLFFTEQSGGGWAPDFNENIRWNVGNLICGSMNCWSRNVLLWNLVLDENSGPKNFGCQDCYGVIDINSKDNGLLHHGEYYALGHFGKIVQPNAFRVYSSVPGDLQATAFLNPDNSIAFLGVFRGNEPKTIGIQLPDRSFSYTFQPGEVCSFLFK